MTEYSPLILANFAYGTGPYLRTTEWALAVADLLRKKSATDHQVIVPLIYGEQQRAIMHETFGTRMHAVILDESYGELLSPLFYGRETYASYLQRWIDTVDKQSDLIRAYLLQAYGRRIALELHRSPRLRIGIAPAFALSFAWQTDILSQARGNPEIAIPDEILEKAIPKFQSIESSFQKTFLTDPGTFSHMKNSQFLDSSISQLVPPTIPTPTASAQPLSPGIYVTVTGIPGLERLFADANRLGMTMYSNNPSALPEAQKALPSVIGNSAIRLHFARSGWSSIWLSLLTDTPFIAAPWDPEDDPEIYFNNQCIEELGIGTVYRGQSLEELLQLGEEQKPQMKQMRSELQKKYGTLDGTHLAAVHCVQ